MAIQHEAVLGGARWRLTLHPDGRWDVQQRTSGGRIWDDCNCKTGALLAEVDPQ